MKPVSTSKPSMSYTPREEKWNAGSHAVGIVMGAIAGGALLWQCVAQQDAWAIFSVLLFVVGMLSSYVASTGYHATAIDSPRRAVWRKWDHAAIYWHIAGAYSPVALIALRQQGGWGYALFAFMWCCALWGTWTTWRGLKKHSHAETLCYVMMGLTAVLFFNLLWQVLSAATLFWIVAEGISYVVGAACYAFYRRRYLHTVFHFFVLLGTACHLVAVALILQDFL